MRYEKELELVLQETMARWDIPGLAFGMVAGGELVCAGGFGVQSLETRAPVTPDTVFSVQSVSKCFVATAVMHMAEGGELDLDAPLVHYLPYFHLDDALCRQVTIRQALSHTSGLPDIDESDYIDWMAQPETDDGAAERFVRSLGDLKLVAAPGERFSYSNIAYNVLGDLLAKVTGQTFENAMQELILAPAGMPRSTFLPSELPRHVLAWPHLRSPEMKANPGYPYQRADAPSSFLHTTVVELCQWAITSLQRGRHAGRSILSAAGYERMWTPVAQRGEPPSLYEHMGLGWTLGHFKGLKSVCHGGAGFGLTAFLLILPEKNCAAVVLCNEESDACYRLSLALADTLIGEKPQAKPASWMVPVSRALAQGGMPAAYACWEALKGAGEQEYAFDDQDLVGLALQLQMANQVDLAIEVLGLNIQVYPEAIDSYLAQARLYLKKGEVTRARERLVQALQIEPANAAAARLLAWSDK